MGVAYNPKIVTDGLVLCLDAANPKSYPGSGNTWFDLSGKNNHASITGTPIGNNTTNFTGTGSYVTIPFNANDFTFDFEQTILLVLRPTENDAVRRNPYDQAYGGGGTWTHEPSGDINFYYGTAGINSSPYVGLGGTGGVTLNEWAIMSTSRNTTANYTKWYKNGKNTFTHAAAYAQVITGTQNIRIGTGYAGGYIGNIDFVAVYNKSLNAEQINQNFQALRGRFGL